MKKTVSKKLASLALGASMVLMTIAPVRADEGIANHIEASTTKGPFYEHSENELRSRKLFRGIANIGLCVAEVPNQAFREAYRTSPITGTVVGAGKGVWKGLKRLAIGTWEVATFYAPMKNNYEPYIQPEVVFMEDLH